MMPVSNPNSRTAPVTRSHAAWCSCRIAHDAAFAHLSLAHFKLRFDQYNHLPVGLQQRYGGGQDQGDGNEADVAGEQVDRLADIGEAAVRAR